MKTYKNGKILGNKDELITLNQICALAQEYYVYCSEDKLQEILSLFPYPSTKFYTYYPELTKLHLTALDLHIEFIPSIILYGEKE